MEWMLLPYKRYADFAGRSRRMEYWMYVLLQVIVGFVLAGIMLAGLPFGELDQFENGTVSSMAGLGPAFYVGLVLYLIWWLFNLIPGIAVTVRRLHDRNMSGWWYLGLILVSWVPFVGIIASIAFVVVLFLDGTPGSNRFGPDPKGRTDAEVFA